MRVRTSVQMVLGVLSLCASSYTMGADFIEYGGCKETDFINVTESEITIGHQGSSYTPACINVKPGTKVTILAMRKHPLQAAQDFENVVNPFRAEAGEHLTDQTRELTEIGFYGFYCTRHADAETGRGMGGMIRVAESF